MERILIRIPADADLNGSRSDSCQEYSPNLTVSQFLSGGLKCLNGLERPYQGETICAVTWVENGRTRRRQGVLAIGLNPNNGTTTIVFHNIYNLVKVAEIKNPPAADLRIYQPRIPEAT